MEHITRTFKREYVNFICPKAFRVVLWFAFMTSDVNLCNFWWQTDVYPLSFNLRMGSPTLVLVVLTSKDNRCIAALSQLCCKNLKEKTRLCSKENFREPFGLPSVLAWVPRPKRWSPKSKFRGALRAPKHFSWGARAS